MYNLAVALLLVLKYMDGICFIFIKYCSQFMQRTETIDKTCVDMLQSLSKKIK